MSYNYDAQLIDSVRLGQSRVEGALMFGEDRLKRRFLRRTGTFTVSVVLAALACLGCFIGGWVISALGQMQARNTPVTTQVPAPAPTQDPQGMAPDRTAPAGTPVAEAGVPVAEAGTPASPAGSPRGDAATPTDPAALPHLEEL